MTKQDFDGLLASQGEAIGLLLMNTEQNAVLEISTIGKDYIVLTPVYMALSADETPETVINEENYEKFLDSSDAMRAIDPYQFSALMFLMKKINKLESKFNF